MSTQADFLGLGAQKSGTSWIYACLSEHPRLFMPFKELHYFSRSRNFDRGAQWYDEHFADRGHGQLAGEFCTSYLCSAESAERIHDYNPDARLIACLRNPVDRAVSQYKHELRTGELAPGTTLGTAISEHPSIVEQGLYSAQLARFDAFARNNALNVAIYEDIADGPQAFLDSIFEFLAVDTGFVPTMLDRRVNVARQPRLRRLDRLMHATSETLRKLGMQSIVNRVKHAGVQDRIYKANTRQIDVEVTAAQRARLYELFAEDIPKVERQIGRDLCIWRSSRVS